LFTRHIFSVEIKREEDKVKQSLKDAAKKGDKATCIVLAKEVARSRKAVNKIYTAQAQIKSVGMNMTNQLGSLKLKLIQSIVI
jgi:charged multivesicular body protein 3